MNSILNFLLGRGAKNSYPWPLITLSGPVYSYSFPKEDSFRVIQPYRCPNENNFRRQIGCIVQKSNLDRERKLDNRVKYVRIQGARICANKNDRPYAIPLNLRGDSHEKRFPHFSMRYQNKKVVVHPRGKTVLLIPRRIKSSSRHAFSYPSTPAQPFRKMHPFFKRLSLSLIFSPFTLSHCWPQINYYLPDTHNATTLRVAFPARRCFQQLRHSHTQVESYIIVCMGGIVSSELQIGLEKQVKLHIFQRVH